nr:C69 family dipeptidase [uncultured Ligilactobacillus sp.]
MAYNQQNLSACTSILVGKKATADGSTMIGRNEDFKSAWPKHMTVHPHKENLQNNHYTSADKNSKFSIDLPSTSFKYTATPEWTTEYGLMEEDGINEYNVAMSATESAYANKRVLGFDPLTNEGIAEEAMINTVLPFIKSAREGVARLGSIVEKHGAAEANGVLFSDVNEVWYMEIGSGHHWVAQRIPDDCYAVVANQLSIQEIDFSDSENFMYSKDIEKFVSKNHLNPSNNGFNFRNIFGTHTFSDEIYNTPRVWDGQRQLNPEIKQEPMSDDLPFIRKANRLIHLDDVQNVLASHFKGTEYDPLGNGPKDLKNKFRPISLAKTQESHILQLRSNVSSKLAGIHWLAMGVAAQSVYVPFYASATDVHEAYKKGAQVYSPDSAYWIYKLVGVLVDPHYLEFGKMLSDVQDELYSKFTELISITDKNATSLDEPQLTEYLTKQSIKIQQLGITKMQELTYQLITESTDMSKLNFKTDLNL